MIMKKIFKFIIAILAILWLIFIFVYWNEYFLYWKVSEAKKEIVTMNECTNLIHKGFDWKYDFEKSTWCDYDKTVQEIMKVKRGQY